MYRSFIKPFLDIFCAFITIILFSPILITVAIILFFLNKGQPFFYQKRPGKNEKVFSIIKFKTMNDKRDKNGDLLPDYKRITSIGRFIRNASIDELPQLFNVLMGQMSFVGPRPLLIYYLPLYNDQQARRHEVKPGITGWAQVNGRNAISWSEKFDYDVWYVNNYNFATDLLILFKTVKKVFKSEGISASETVTMEYFTGDN